MDLTPQKPYHPQLHKMLRNWTTQYPYKRNQEALDFMLHIGRQHDDDSLVKWTIDLHNQVNETLGKRKWGYEEALNLYKRYYKNLDESNELRNIEFSTNITENNKLVVKGIQITVLILLISFCFYYLVKNRNKNFKKIIRL